eukprot:6639687-Alexandrium_andersonii.AAC.1
MPPRLARKCGLIRPGLRAPTSPQDSNALPERPCVHTRARSGVHASPRAACTARSPRRSPLRAAVGAL